MTAHFLVNHRCGQGHLAQACHEHQLARIAHAHLLDALVLDRDGAGVTAGRANDVVFQRAVGRRVVPDINAAVYARVPDLLVRADIQCFTTSDEVVARVAVRIAVPGAHAGQRAQEVQAPGVAFLPRYQRATSQPGVQILLGAHTLLLTGTNSLRVVDLHQHAFRRCQGLTVREVGSVQDTGRELALVLREFEPRVIRVQEFFQAIVLMVSMGQGPRRRVGELRIGAGGQGKRRGHQHAVERTA